MITVRLYLEDIEGDWFGWMEGFPGAYTQGATMQEAQLRAPDALLNYLHWLHSNEDTIPPLLQQLSRTDVEAVVVEAHHAAFTDDGYEINGFFEPDARPAEDEDIVTYLRLLHHSRADLYRAATAIAPDQWDMAPFGGKSVRSILQHVAATEQTYLEYLGIEMSTLPQTGLRDQMDTIRRDVETAIPLLTNEQRAAVTVIDGERWSLRKVLRRALWHERYHAMQIAARSNPNEYLRTILVDPRLHYKGIRVVR